MSFHFNGNNSRGLIGVAPSSGKPSCHSTESTPILCVPEVNLMLRNTAPAGPKQTKTAKGSGMNPWAGGMNPLVAGGLNGLNPLVAGV